MKKILLSLLVLFIASAAFADTIYVTTGNNVKVYSGLKEAIHLNHNKIQDNEYYLLNGNLHFKYKGKIHICSNFEIVVE